MAFVAVKAAGAGLVAVAGLGVDGGDHPVGGDLRGDPEAAIGVLLQVLAHHGGQQPSGLGHPCRQRAALQDPSIARASTSAARAAWSSQSICGLAGLA